VLTRTPPPSFITTRTRTHALRRTWFLLLRSGVDTRKNRLQLYQRQFLSSNHNNDDSDDDGAAGAARAAQMQHQNNHSNNDNTSGATSGDGDSSSGATGLRAMLGPFVPPSPRLKSLSPTAHDAAGGGGGEQATFSVGGSDPSSSNEAHTGGLPPRLKGYAKPVTGYVYERVCEKHREFQNPKPKAVRDALAAKAAQAAAAAAAAEAAAAAAAVGATVGFFQLHIARPHARH